MQQLEPLYPGGQAWITIWGKNFGPQIGSVRILLPGSNLDSGITAAVVPPYGTWVDTLPVSGEIATYGQVNALLDAWPTVAVGPYDVQIVSRGTEGRFFAAQEGQDRSQRAQGAVQVSPIPVPIVKILRDGSDITNTSRTVIIGEQISLTSSVVLLNGTALSAGNWTIGGSYVGGFTSSQLGQGNTCPPLASNPTANVAHPCNPTTDTPQTMFYFTDSASSVDVSYSITGDDGRPYSAKTTFRVVKPTADTSFDPDAPPIQVTRLNESGIVVDEEPGYLALRYGSGTTAGISFIPNFLIPSGYSGTTQWVQVTTTATTTRTLVGSNQPTTRDCSNRLDSSYPYDARQGGTTDSPNNQLLVGYQDYNRNDSYIMMLEFKPALPNAIFVPFAKVVWNWGAHVQSTDGGLTWTFVPTSKAVTNPSPKGQYTSTFSSWTANTTTCGYI